jgi:hypothetical protein
MTPTYSINKVIVFFSIIFYLPNYQVYKQPVIKSDFFDLNQVVRDVYLLIKTIYFSILETISFFSEVHLRTKSE